MMVFDKHRWPLIALVASLGGNLFLAGWVVGGGFAHPFMPPGPPQGPDRMIERLAEKLAPQDARIVREAIDRNREAMRSDDERRRSFPDRMRATLLADPFDASRLESLLREEEDREAANRKRLNDEIVSVSKQLSSDARHRLASFRPGPPGDPGPR